MAALSIIKLVAVALTTILVSIGFYLLQKKTPFGKWKGIYQQLVIGVAFGGVAIMGTELGTSINGATLNLRDAAPLCAGLIFGAPAGLIAGVLGGVERYFAVYWGAGAFTQIACSISTILAGIIAAILRKWMFDDKKPNWFYAMVIAMVVEVIHMLMIFLTNMNQVSTAFALVEKISVWMILGSMVVVALSSLSVALLGKEKLVAHNEQRRLAQSFQKWLFLDVIVAFVLTSTFTYVVQSRLSLSDADSTLSLNLTDLEDEISAASNNHLLSSAELVTENDVNTNPTTFADYYTIGMSTSDMLKASSSGNAKLVTSASTYRVTTISVVNSKGYVIYSNIDSYVGFQMDAGSGQQSTEFYDAFFTWNLKSYVQSYGPISQDSDILMKFGAWVDSLGGFVQVGYDGARLQSEIDAIVENLTANRRVGKTGYLLIADSSYAVKSQPADQTPIATVTSSLFQSESFKSFRGTLYGQDFYGMQVKAEGYYLLSALPVAEVDFVRNLSIYVTIFMEVIVFAMLFAAVYFLIKKLVVENIERINGTLGEITEGNLNVSVDVRTNQEFSSLSDDINSTVVTLKGYIKEAAARIDKELEFAKEIQLSALPGGLDGKDRFALKARMRTAKEVGGDFYDYFLIDDHRIALVIADVSGKGIPAALFMMKSKTLIKSLAEGGSLSSSAILEKANAELALGNEAEMFVTVWLGIYDFTKEVLVTANAGHEFPAFSFNGAPFSYFKDKHGFVLAGMKGSHYKECEIPFHPGDTLFVYTDGVTEATNSANQLFGDERLLAALNGRLKAKPSGHIDDVFKAIDAFDGEAPQFDDITMLCFHVYSPDEKVFCPRELTLEAKVENIEEVTAFVDKALADYSCPLKVQMQVDVAIDEIFSNIAHYAYAPRTGLATVKIEKTSDPDGLQLVFIDEGIPFDPLKKADPDVKAKLEDRAIGGLGIFMVKKSMDEVRYLHSDNKNILTLIKHF